LEAATARPPRQAGEQDGHTKGSQGQVDCIHEFARAACQTPREGTKANFCLKIIIIGGGTLAVEVLNVSRHGFWLCVAGQEHFLIALKPKRRAAA